MYTLFLYGYGIKTADCKLHGCVKDMLKSPYQHVIILSLCGINLKKTKPKNYKTMKKILISTCGALLFCLFLTPSGLFGQSDVYDKGTVWQLTMVKLKANMGDDYLKGLSKTWKASMDMMVKENMIKSYKILSGAAANDDDFDLLLMVEFENMASLDPNTDRDKKMDEIEKKIKAGMGDEYKNTISNYQNIREISGSKLMREIYLK